jgi:hypothetical protein
LQLILKAFRFLCNQKLELSQQSKVRNYVSFPFGNINSLKTNKLQSLGYGLQLISRVFRFACNQKLELSKQSKV